MINSFKNPAIMRILRTTERHGAGWREQNFIPDKEAAYRELFRVLRPGGTFCGCFYVKGEQKRTDWFVRHVYEKTGFFTPPYETAFSLKKRLGKLYAAVTLGTVKSMAWFVCRKGLR